MFSLGQISQGRAEFPAHEVTAALGAIQSEAEAEHALYELASYGEMVPADSLSDALGAMEALGAALSKPQIKMARPQTQAKAFGQLERLRGIVSAGTRLQAEYAQRPNVFLCVRFNHTVANTLVVNDLKPSLPAQSTYSPGASNAPLRLIQARTYLISGAIQDAEIDIAVARVPAAQYAAPAGQAEPVGLPIEYWSNTSYRMGIRPPYIRGLEAADANTVIKLTSTSNAAIDYRLIFEFVMVAFMGGECGRIMPSLSRGPMSIIRH